MSDPIVIELQRLASDNSTEIGNLLRKALIVATKLKIDDFAEWINAELHGYPNAKELPLYRIIACKVQGTNPVTGRLMPMFYSSRRTEQHFSTVSVIEPIGQLGELLASDGAFFHMSLSPSERRVFLEGMDTPIPIECHRHISRTSVCGIADAVRNQILEWSLRLEQQGILGEGMRFTSEEKAAAMTSQSIHIGNFQGVLGDVTNSTVTQNQQMTINPGDFDSLSRTLTEAGLSREDIDALKKSIDADPVPKSESEFGPNVRNWITTMMGKAIDGAWTASLATGGKLISDALAAYYGI